VSKIIVNVRTDVDGKWKFEMFENVLSNLLKKLVFGVEKRMNTVSFVDVETTDKILSQYQSISSQSLLKRSKCRLSAIRAH
jgi:hypothetical protein